MSQKPPILSTIMKYYAFYDCRTLYRRPRTTYESHHLSKQLIDSHKNTSHYTLVRDLEQFKEPRNYRLPIVRDAKTNELLLNKYTSRTYERHSSVE